MAAALATTGYMGTMVEAAPIDAANTLAMSVIIIIVVVLFAPGSVIPSLTLGDSFEIRYKMKNVAAAAIPTTDVFIDANRAIFEKYDNIIGNTTTSKMILIVKSLVTSVNKVGSIVATQSAIPFATYDVGIEATILFIIGTYKKVNPLWFFHKISEIQKLVYINPILLQGP